MCTHVMYNCASFPIDENRPFPLCTISVSLSFFLLLYAVLIYLHRTYSGKSKESAIENRLNRHLMKMLIHHDSESEKLRFSFKSSFSLPLLLFFHIIFLLEIYVIPHLRSLSLKPKRNFDAATVTAATRSNVLLSFFT